MIHFRLFHPMGAELAGLIPSFLNDNDPRSARGQLDHHYSRVCGYKCGYGGWRPFEGFKMTRAFALKYPGDPLIRPVAQISIRAERVFIYPHAWVAIVQPDGTFEAARMD